MGKSHSKKAKSRVGLLMKAIEDNDPVLVKKLIRNGVSVNDKDDSVLGSAPLHLAVTITQNVQIVDELIRHNADLNARNAVGSTALYLGAMTGNIEIVKLLTRSKADVNIKCEKGLSPLFIAVQGGHVQVLQELVRNNADVSSGRLAGFSPVNWAARFGRTEMVRELLRCKAYIGSEGDGMTTPLHHAAGYGHLDIIRVLLQYGADVNAKVEYGLGTAVLWAIEAGNVGITKELINLPQYLPREDPKGIGALYQRAFDGEKDFLLLIADNERIVKCSLYSWTALHICASLGYHQHLAELLHRNVNLNAKDIFGCTPLHWSVCIGNLKLITDLVDAGASLQILDASGKSLLHYAAIYGHCNVFSYLGIELGLDPCALDFCGRTCLHYAVMYRQAGLVTLLQELGAGLVTKDSCGKFPIDYLYEFEKDSAISKILRRQPFPVKVLSLKGGHDFRPRVYNVRTVSDLLKQPYLGPVKNIEGFDMEKFKSAIENTVAEIVGAVIPESSEIEVIGCGSSFGGSKVGLPDEFDFVVKLFDAAVYSNDFEGYGRMERQEEKGRRLGIIGSYGIWLWGRLLSYWAQHCGGDQVVSGGRVRMPLPPQRHPDRKTCTTWIWLYTDDMFHDLPISIDFVPAIFTDRSHDPNRKILDFVDRDGGNGRCYIVPKVPHHTSTAAFLPQELNRLGRISYPSLEAESIRCLDQRLRDVLIAVKLLRKPEVCGIQFQNEDGDIVQVGEYATSYRLKTVFLHLVKVFSGSSLSLGKMVLMVYERLVLCLEMEKLPMFFDQDVNILAGSRLSAKSSLVAAKVMLEFVRLLYERDSSPETRGDDEQELATVLREEMKLYVKKRSEFEHDRSQGMTQGSNTTVDGTRPKIRKPVLPLYLKSVVIHCYPRTRCKKLAAWP